MNYSNLGGGDNQHYALNPKTNEFEIVSPTSSGFNDLNTYDNGGSKRGKTILIVTLVMILLGVIGFLLYFVILIATATPPASAFPNGTIQNTVNLQANTVTGLNGTVFMQIQNNARVDIVVTPTAGQQLTYMVNLQVNPGGQNFQFGSITFPATTVATGATVTIPMAVNMNPVTDANAQMNIFKELYGTPQASNFRFENWVMNLNGQITNGLVTLQGTLTLTCDLKVAVGGVTTSTCTATTTKYTSFFRGTSKIA